MSEQYTIRRAAEGPCWPFGAGAVAAGGALLGGIVALVTPMAALDWLAYQSYLDQIAGLTAPLGGKAKLAFVALLAMLFGANGYFVARWAGVRSTGGFAELLARLRGVRDEDEEDAPRLRGSDRHPDAPARRPLSATRDLPLDRANAGRGAVSAPDVDDGDDDEEDELLLISPMATEVLFEVPLRPLPVAQAPIVSDAPIPMMPLRESASAPAPVAMDFADAVDWPDDDDVDSAAPHADDWLTAPAPAPMPSASPDEWRQADKRLPKADPPLVAADSAPAPVAPPIAAPAAMPVFAAELPRMRAAPPPPLDLSVARLDELIARVEAGMMRRASAPVAEQQADEVVSAPPVTITPAPATPDVAAPVMAEPVTETADPSFPHDPALAAALATLRRMAAA